MKNKIRDTNPSTKRQSITDTDVYDNEKKWRYQVESCGKRKPTSSPTPDFYAFKYVIAVIAKEGRDCATVDLPGFFIQIEQEENSDLLLKLTGQVTTLLIESDKDKWQKHLRQENGKDVLYVKCDKAIYGTMNAALLVAYKKLVKLFSEWGFVMNPYNPCVWNKMVGKHQMNIMFHIDDLLMSHKHPHIVTLFIKKLEAVYGKRDPLMIANHNKRTGTQIFGYDV